MSFARHDLKSTRQVIHSRSKVLANEIEEKHLEFVLHSPRVVPMKWLSIDFVFPPSHIGYRGFDIAAVVLYGMRVIITLFCLSAKK